MAMWQPAHIAVLFALAQHVDVQDDLHIPGVMDSSTPYTRDENELLHTSSKASGPGLCRAAAVTRLRQWIFGKSGTNERVGRFPMDTI